MTILRLIRIPWEVILIVVLLALALASGDVYVTDLARIGSCVHVPDGTLNVCFGR